MSRLRASRYRESWTPPRSDSSPSPHRPAGQISRTPLRDPTPPGVYGSPARGDLSVSGCTVQLAGMSSEQVRAVGTIAQKASTSVAEAVRLADLCRWLRADLDDKDAVLAERDALIAELRCVEDARLRKFRESQERVVAALEQQLCEARQDIAERDEMIGDLRVEVATCAAARLEAGSVRRLRDEIDTLRESEQRMREELQVVRSDALHQGGRVRAVTEEASELRGQLHASRAEALSALARCEELQTAAEQSERERDGLLREVARLRADVLERGAASSADG
eukprot:TRINITY_DN14105_c0_g1_i2.p1 TRINITY_DN14105_c0_g1~~TRINITY_DN14105_c0_g1_i2.p1  ORF type:complete len:281 (+),score=78.60 TRINITY_DN14105_c0_g1_i2:74-916(+)